MVNPTLQMGKLRHRQVKHLAQGHITSEQGAGIEPRLSGSRVIASSDSSFLDKSRERHFKTAGDRGTIIPDLPDLQCPEHGKYLIELDR